MKPINDSANSAGLRSQVVHVAKNLKIHLITLV